MPNGLVKALQGSGLLLSGCHLLWPDPACSCAIPGFPFWIFLILISLVPDLWLASWLHNLLISLTHLLPMWYWPGPGSNLLYFLIFQICASAACSLPSSACLTTFLPPVLQVLWWHKLLSLSFYFITKSSSYAGQDLLQVLVPLNVLSHPVINFGGQTEHEV